MTFQTGKGLRGLTSKEEYYTFDSGITYIKCLNPLCNFSWEVPTSEWNENPPQYCPNCNSFVLSSERIVYDVFPQRYIRIDGTLQIVRPENRWERAGIERIIRADTIDAHVVE